MNIAEYAIRKKTVSLVLTTLLVLGGIISFLGLGRLEDPEFTIKQALVVTAYPGASPEEVVNEVTDEIETAVQQMQQVKLVTSMSRAGLSVVTVETKDKYDKETMPQVWDELRRKINDVQSSLPPGVVPLVRDDFGDVYGILLAVTGDGYSYSELKEYISFLRKELLLVKDVAKVDVWGEQEEAVFVEISRSRMARLGIGLDVINDTLKAQNLVVPAGSAKVGPDYIRIDPTGTFDSVEDIENLNIRDPKSQRLIYLRDIAEVKHGYVSPPGKILRFDGKPAISIGISIASGGNVVDLGEAVRVKLDELKDRTPVGIEFGVVNYQGDDVANAVDGFVLNFVEAVVIVIAVLLIFMGLRCGLLIGAVLIITVLGTFVFMSILDINLQRISLGALIIALGMLVDNAIVVTEGMLVKMRMGKSALVSAREVGSQNLMPLLGATVIAILAFAGIGLSQDNTGEFCGSLFKVMLISLMLSWVLAMTITPLFSAMILKTSENEDPGKAEPYKGWIFIIYRRILETCIKFRWATVLVLIVMLFSSIYGFTLLKGSFFPDSTKSQFLIHYWLPSGGDIRQTSADMKIIEDHLLDDERVEATAAYIGQGATRYMLTYAPNTTMEKSYGVILVNVKDYESINIMIPELEEYLAENFPNAEPRVKRHVLGPSGDAPIEARFSGPDPAVLRSLSNQAQDIFRQHPNSASIRDNWRHRVKVIQPIFDETRAQRSGITRPLLNQALEGTFTGNRVGIFRDGDEMIPIISRLPESERMDVDNLGDVQIWSPYTGQMVPISQVVSGFDTIWEDPMIHRRNRKMTITAYCDAKFGVLASTVFKDIKPLVEGIELPQGYEMEWGGEYEDSMNAQQGIGSNMLPTLLAMVVIVIMLFNNLRQPLIIWLTVPLATIGVAVGLLVGGIPFGFMALLGFLSLMGMLIKNSIVLLDQLNIELESGKKPYTAVLDASVSRLRPVCMAAVTTVLGMIPLIADDFFVGMAVTIMSGLSFATILTLVVVPVLYCILYRVRGADI